MARYKFLNVNPLGKIEEDCVCRAITNALQEDYYLVLEKLYLVQELFECDALCVCCYKFLLDNVYSLERIEEFKGFTIEDFCEFFPKGVYLVRVEGHLTCVVNGIVEDTWDCTQKIVDIVWKVE